jgi:hypothetical protein
MSHSANSAIRNLDNRRSTDDSFSINQGEAPPKNTKTNRQQQKQKEKKNWRLRHLAEK